MRSPSTTRQFVGPHHRGPASASYLSSMMAIAPFRGGGCGNSEADYRATTSNLTDSGGSIGQLRRGRLHGYCSLECPSAPVARGTSSRRAIATVDKFQGQQAPIVFFSVGTSSGEDVPCNLAFLFSRNRLNVAISRAQCLAYPRLFGPPPRSPMQFDRGDGTGECTLPPRRICRAQRLQVIRALTLRFSPTYSLRKTASRSNSSQLEKTDRKKALIILSNADSYD